MNNFITDWSRFMLDLWWRRKYKVPFGSPAHRAMNFIDMAIEYQEELLWNKAVNTPREEVDEEEEYINSQIQDDTENVKLTQEQIDEDYENLDLEQFDEKESEEDKEE